MPRGEGRDLQKSLPKRDPFRQEILSREDLEKRQDKKTSHPQEKEVPSQEGLYPQEGLGRLERLSRGQSARLRKGEDIVVSTQEMQARVLADIYNSGYLAYLSASGFTESERGAFYDLALRQGLRSAAQAYLDIGIALGSCFSPEEGIAGRKSFINGELIHFNQLLLEGETKQLKDTEIVLSLDEEDFRKKELLNELGDVKLPLQGKDLLPPPGFTESDVSELIALLEEHGDQEKFPGEGKDSFILGLWLGLWANYRQKVIFLKKR